MGARAHLTIESANVGTRKDLCDHRPKCIRTERGLASAAKPQLVTEENGKIGSLVWRS